MDQKTHLKPSAFASDKKLSLKHHVDSVKYNINHADEHVDPAKARMKIIAAKDPKLAKRLYREVAKVTKHKELLQEIQVKGVQGGKPKRNSRSRNNSNS